MSIREMAIPGVRCGKCLGRIDDGADAMKRKLHAKLYPNEPYVGPRLCSECWLGAALSFAEDDDEPTETK